MYVSYNYEAVDLQLVGYLTQIVLKFKKKKILIKYPQFGNKYVNVMCVYIINILNIKIYERMKTAIYEMFVQTHNE